MKQQKIPPPPDPDDPARAADAALYHGFVALGERTAAPQTLRSSRRRHRFVRELLLTFAGLVVVVGGAVATKAILPDDGSVQIDQNPGKIAQAPGDRRLGAARAGDPHNSTTWGVRLYYNNAGETCALAGAVDHGRLGRIRDGKFKQLPDHSPGVCHNMADHVFTTIRTYSDTPEPRAVLYGLVDRSILSLQLQTRDGKRRDIPIAPDGSYVLPLAGRQPLADSTLTIQTTTHHTTKHKLNTRPFPTTLKP